VPDASCESDDPDVTTVVSQINIYLREHPNSADTAEGIARWWFASVPRPTTEQVRVALRWMEALGVVEALPAADGKVRYRLRRGKSGPAGRSPPMSGGR
jgi:Fe2+ or Zn2+ uptake regulation protein